MSRYPCLGDRFEDASLTVNWILESNARRLLGGMGVGVGVEWPLGWVDVTTGGGKLEWLLPPLFVLSCISASYCITSCHGHQYYFSRLSAGRLPRADCLPHCLGQWWTETLFSSVTETPPPPPSSCSANANTLYRRSPSPPSPPPPPPQSLWLLLSCPSWRRFPHAHLPVSGD